MYGTRRVPIQGLIQARNVTFENQQLEKEGGAARQNPAALPGPVRALHDWWPDPTTQRTVAVTLGGGVYLDDGVSWGFAVRVLPEGTLNTSRPPVFVDGGQETPAAVKKLFLYTGTAPIQVGLGDFTSLSPLDVAKRPADWAGARQPTCGLIHEGRHFAFLGHNAYYTPSSSHEAFVGTGSGMLPIAPGEGEAIVAVTSFRKMLIVFKRPRGVYVVETTGDPATWRYDVQSKAVGATGPWAVASIPNDILFLDTTGALHMLSATAVERDATSSDVTSLKLGTWIREHIDAQALESAAVVWYGDKNVAYAILPARGHVARTRAAFQLDTVQADAFQASDTSTDPTVGPPIYRLVVGLNAPEVGPWFAYSDRDTVTCLVLRRFEGVARPYIGTEEGFVYRLDMPQRSKDGLGYLGEWQTEHTDLGELVPEWRGRVKNFDYLELWLEGIGTYTLSVDIYIDGAKKTATPLSFSLAGIGVPLGVFVLGVDRLAEPLVVHRRRRLPWRGTRISIRGYNSGAGETFKVLKAFVGATAAE